MPDRIITDARAALLAKQAACAHQNRTPVEAVGKDLLMCMDCDLTWGYWSENPSDALVRNLPDLLADRASDRTEIERLREGFAEKASGLLRKAWEWLNYLESRGYSEVRTLKAEIRNLLEGPSDRRIEIVAKALADRRGHGMTEKCLADAEAALAALDRMENPT